MACGDAERVHQYFDHELDTPGALEVERHVATCSDCSDLLRELEATRRSLREHARYHRAGAALHARIGDALDRETPSAPAPRSPVAFRRTFWSGAVGGAFATALAAAFAFIAFMPAATTPLVTDVVNAHVRSLLGSHLLDVASSDHHTVKPWFAGHVDVSPPAADFAALGYTLVGGRVDYVDGHRAAVTVYRHGAHVINVFAWAAEGASVPADATRNGYHAVFWRNGTVMYCAVSDTALDELMTLKRLVASRAAAEGGE